MHSSLVVISWWSNALGLECLHRLKHHARERTIYVVQVGKSPEGRARFRDFLPTGVTELDYPDDAPAEHSRVIRSVALEHLAPESGLWLIDHDVFFEEACESWLSAADAWFEPSEMCLCVHSSPDSPAITQPAFWMSPARWTADIPDIDPIPFEARAESRRPDLYRNDGQLRMPVKDTLVRAYEKLSLLGRACEFHLPNEAPTPLPSFPRHTHLGGLSLFAGPVGLPALGDWARTTVTHFGQFFEASPWLEAEDPELLRRLAEFRQWMLSEENRPDDSPANEPVPHTNMAANQGETAWTPKDLGEWPDEQLAEITPMVVTGCKITVRDGYVWGVPPSVESPRRLFRLGSPALLVFNGFNGLNLLAEVSANLAAEMGWNATRAFAFTRDLFLSLATAGVCCPKYQADGHQEASG
jgi:hypothetical protein